MCMYAIYHPSHVWIDPSLVTVFYVEALPKKEVLRFPAKPPGAGDYAGARPRCWKGLSSARPRLSCHIFPRTIHTTAKGMLGRAGRCRGKTCGVVLSWPFFPGARPFSPGADSRSDIREYPDIRVRPMRCPRTWPTRSALVGGVCRGKFFALKAFYVWS